VTEQHHMSRRSGEDEEVQRLVAYARSLRPTADLPRWGRASADLDHIGAKLADAALQRATNYEKIVRPRVRALAERYPEARTVSGLRRAISEHGAEAMLGVKGGPKPATFTALADALAAAGVETVADLKSYLDDRWRANRLRLVDGVGPKTVAFLKLLVGLEAVAVDMHILRAMKAAGVAPCDASEAERLFVRAAEALGMTASELDAHFWRHGSGTTGDAAPGA
jgi:hypothetical protein